MNNLNNFNDIKNSKEANYLDILLSESDLYAIYLDQLIDVAIQKSDHEALYKLLRYKNKHQSEYASEMEIIVYYKDINTLITNGKLKGKFITKPSNQLKISLEQYGITTFIKKDQNNNDNYYWCSRVQ